MTQIDTGGRVGTCKVVLVLDATAFCTGFYFFCSCRRKYKGAICVLIRVYAILVSMLIARGPFRVRPLLRSIRTLVAGFFVNIMGHVQGAKHHREAFVGVDISASSMDSAGPLRLFWQGVLTEKPSHAVLRYTCGRLRWIYWFARCLSVRSYVVCYLHALVYLQVRSLMFAMHLLLPHGGCLMVRMLVCSIPSMLLRGQCLRPFHRCRD